MRFGIGYDIHRLVSGRLLVLGGVEIPFERGLMGHSDADVLLHALADALLGAAGLGDIGQHFPDTDPAYKNISSLVLLKRVYELLADAGHQAHNVDVTVIAQAPRLADYIGQMKLNIADTLHLDPLLVNIKATTNEGLDSIGRGEAIAAMAIASVEPVKCS
ncbi:2-C-methyl-D-erythritol 2,4-cyclodiphosphate synthase [bacterium]|nr:2-C-methyl-D-erythritol 2,4-cyclodiphosphate synthase [bacterium]